MNLCGGSDVHVGHLHLPKLVHPLGQQLEQLSRLIGLGEFRFHDLRHCGVNNLQLTGNDYFTIMALSGHTTMSTFKRYSLVMEEELKNVAWKNG